MEAAPVLLQFRARSIAESKSDLRNRPRGRATRSRNWLCRDRYRQHEAWLYSTSTSAGAMTRGSSVSEMDGMRTFVTTHPWCFRVPLKGGAPLTLPVNRTRSGSYPLGTVMAPPSAPGMADTRSINCCRILRQPPCTTRAAAPISASEYPDEYGWTELTGRFSR